MRHLLQRGFTLIELLTVIAIIAILASMTAVVGPRVIERTKWARFVDTCRQLSTSAVGYMTANPRGTFPRAYGYKLWPQDKPQGMTDNQLTDIQKYSLKPFMATVSLPGKMDLYDIFSPDTHDTDRDNDISLLEFCPVGTKSGPSEISYPEELYTMDNLGNFDNEVNKQLKEKRPLVYLPVNSKQFANFYKYCELLAGQSGAEVGYYARRWLPNQTFSGQANPIANISFPPTKYDDFVLITVGPENNTGGILTAPDEFMNDVMSAANGDWGYVYHALVLRAYYLATRDLNQNGLFDFDFRNRSRADEADPGNYSEPNMNFLPNGTNLGGPGIYRYSGGGVGS